MDENARLGRLREMSRLAEELAGDDDPVVGPASNRMLAIITDVLRTIDLDGGDDCS